MRKRANINKVASLLLVGAVAMTSICLSGCSKEEVSENIGNVVNGAIDAANNIDGDKLADGVTNIVGSIGSGLIKGAGKLLASADKEKVAEGISNVIETVTKGTVDGVTKAQDVIKEATINKDSVSKEDAAKLLEDIKNSKETLKKEYKAGKCTEDDYEKRLKTLEDLEKSLK